MTAPSFIGIVFTGIALLGLATGGFFLLFAWVSAMMTAATCVLERSWRGEDHGWRMAAMLCVAGALGLTVGGLALGAIHLFKLMPTL